MTAVLDGVAPRGEHFAFVGRGRELGLLLAAVRRPPAVVLVEGEAGIGKSRLVREAMETVAGEGGRVLTGYCHPLREPAPYGPLADALHRAGQWLPTAGLPPTAGDLALLLPNLADRLPPRQPEDARPKRYRMFQAVHSFLSALGPVVLVVEDLHWIDEATRELLLLLARDLPGQLSLVLTYRAEGLQNKAPVLGAAYRQPPGTSGTTIRLAPLGAEEVGELAASVLGAGATPALSRALFERSQGLPLVAEEDLITLGEQVRRFGTAGQADLVTGLDQAGVPYGLSEAVAERLATLSAVGSAVVDAAAVLAVPATEELLAAVARLGAEESEQGLTEALRAAVLCEDDAGRYLFRHALAQQVVYQHIPGPRRVRLHRRAVEELEALSPSPLVQIAHHTLAAGDRAAWFRRAEEAADQAAALGDTGTGAALLQQILDQPDLDEEVRSRAALALARAADYTVDYQSTAEVLRRILADPQLPEAVRGEIRLGLALLLGNHVADRSAAQEFEQAIRELSARPERAVRAMLALSVYEQDGRTADAWTWLQRAEEAVRGSPDAGLHAAVRATRMILMMLSADPAVWTLVDELPRQDEDAEVARQAARALVGVGTCATLLGHDRRAKALLTEGRELAQRAGILSSDIYYGMTLLYLDVLGGQWAGIEERCAELAREFPGVARIPLQQAQVAAWLAIARGQPKRAADHLDRVLAEAEKLYDVTTSLIASAGLAAVRLLQGSPQEAWAIAAPAVATLRQTGMWPRAIGLVPAAVAAALAAGHRAEAERLVADVEHGLAGRDSPAALAELEVARGLLRQDEDPLDAAGHFVRAADMWRNIGRPYFTAGAAEQAGAALARVRPEQATAHLTEAIRIYTDLDAIAGTARCRRILDELGVARPAPAGRRGYGDRLSPREQEVARLLAGGATNQEIADTLFLSPRTVEHHVANVLRKLDTSRKNVGQALDG